MAKVNNTRKSDSWRPGMVANGSGMISKNQKRKEKRHSHSLSMLKSQETPTKKSMLGPLSKFKENLNQSLNVPSLGKKESKLLSTSLPIKADKKSTPLLKKNAKPTGILSNSNTPKSKGSKVTFNMDKNVDKFIDSEAEEGEEPVTDKVVKPYEKGSQRKQQLKRKMSMMDVEESEDEDGESDDESNDSASQFLDMEVSEGEETDSLDDEESYDENSDDDSSDNDSDEEVDDEDESAEEMESGEEENPEGDSEEESDDESEEEMAAAKSSKVVATPNRRESMAAAPVKKEKAESTPLPKKVAVKPESVTPQPKKVDVKVESTPKLKKVNVKTESEQKKVNVKAVPEPKKEKLKTEAPVKGKAQATVDKKIPSQEKVEEDDEKKVKETVVGETSPFVGFIRKIFKKISIDDVKSALSQKIDAKNIVGLRLARDRNVFVYLKDEDTLNLLLNHSFPVNENFKFVVYKARDSTSEKKPKFVAFLPKVPFTTTVEELKDAIVKHVGADCVASVQFRRVFKQLQTRNVLVHFTDVESLKKMVHTGDLQVGSAKIIFRAAYETTVDVPTYRVLITSIPEKTSEAAMKKAIESQVGLNTVQNIQYSQKKSSFAFVTMKNEEAQKKILELSKNILVNGTNLEVIEFKPRQPMKKRAAPTEQAKEKKKNKAKKQKLADGTASNAPNPGKKNKAAAAAQQKDASPKANIQKPHQTPSKGAAAQTNAKKEAQNVPGQEVDNKSKKNKQFRKPGKGANANQKPQSPVKGPAPGKGAHQKQELPTPAKGSTLGKGANPKQEPQSPANSPAAGKGANPKHQQKKSKKGAVNGKPQSPSPVSVSVNGASPSSPKQNKKKNKNRQQQQRSPKPVDAKKQALVEKIASKKKNKKNSMKRDAS